MKIHYGVISSWIGSVAIYELAKHLSWMNYGLVTVATVIVLFGSLILEDVYGKETK